MSRSVVLLVDDNTTHQYSLRKHLEESGYEVLQAHSGNEAGQMAVAHRPDLILLDINLPDVSGFTICQQLKADPRTNSIPVVFHSATHDTASARSQARDLGAVSFLSYPIDVDHLINVLKAAIMRSQRGSSLQS